MNMEINPKIVWFYILLILILALFTNLLFSYIIKPETKDSETKKILPGAQCQPFVCKDGANFPSCQDGSPINYLLNPCHDHGGESFE